MNQYEVSWEFCSCKCSCDAIGMACHAKVAGNWDRWSALRRIWQKSFMTASRFTFDLWTHGEGMGRPCLDTERERKPKKIEQDSDFWSSLVLRQQFSDVFYIWLLCDCQLALVTGLLESEHVSRLSALNVLSVLTRGISWCCHVLRLSMRIASCLA